MSQDPDRSAGESKAYREGKVDQRLAAFDRHFQDLNGSVEKTGDALQELKDEVTGQRRDIADLLTSVEQVVPQVRQLVAEGIGTKQVAEALEGRKKADDTGGDRWRTKVAWATGIAGTLVVLVGVAARLLGF